MLLYAIEVSGVCNLACDYCPYRLQQRKRGFLSPETLNRILYLLDTGEMKVHLPLFLHLFGEPMMHPQFIEIASRIKEVIRDISWSTNGFGVTMTKAEEIAQLAPSWITISPHKPATAKAAEYFLKAVGVKVRMHGGPDHNWAGQISHDVKWSESCNFTDYDMVVIRWNGDVAQCCISDSDQGIIGSIWDKDLKYRKRGFFELCKTCHLKRRYDYGEGKAVSVGGVQGMPA